MNYQSLCVMNFLFEQCMIRICYVYVNVDDIIIDWNNIKIFIEILHVFNIPKSNRSERLLFGPTVPEQRYAFI